MNEKHELLILIRKELIDLVRKIDSECGFGQGKSGTSGKNCTECDSSHRNTIALCDTCNKKLLIEQRGMWS